MLDDNLCLRVLRFQAPASSLAFSKKIAGGLAFPRATGLPITLLIDKVTSTRIQVPSTTLLSLQQALGCWYLS